MTTQTETQTVTTSPLASVDTIQSTSPTVELTTRSNSNPSGIACLFDDGSINHSMISAEDKARYAKLTENISCRDINSVANFGSELCHTMSKHSNAFLSAVRVNNAGDELSSLIMDLQANLGEIDVDELTPTSSFKRLIRRIPVINKLFSSVTKVLQKYDTIDKSVDTIASKISAARFASLKDNNALQKLFSDNVQYLRQIEELVIAAKLKYEETLHQLEEMKANPAKYTSYEIADVQNFLNNLDHRISDMTVLHVCMSQSLPQIRLIQNSNLETANKAQSMISITIPLWRTQLSTAVALKRQEGRVKALKIINDTTNEMVNRNADLLHQNSIEIAKENERGIVEIETLRHASQRLIDTINEVRDIHTSAVRQRREMEAEILKIENHLEAALSSGGDNTNYLYRQ